MSLSLSLLSLLSSILLLFLSQLSHISRRSLLQLANIYAISNSSPWSKSNSLRDKIGMCYVLRNRLSSRDELKIAYSPRGDFNLRDFHHAVNSLPSNAFMPDADNNSVVMISNVLSDQVLYSWEGKDIERKVIVITSGLPEDVDSALQKSLMDAADRCVSVDFALFQQKSSHLTDTREIINNFRRSISLLDNCSFQTYIPDFRVLHSLVKRWLQVLKDDTEEPLQVCLTFKDSLLDSVNQIFCSLHAPANPITNGFSQCQTCRCHGTPLENAERRKINGLFCPVTGGNLETGDVVENSVRVGEKTILFLPSFHSSSKLLQITCRIDITVIERTNLASVDEGLIMGASYVVIPSPYHVMEATADDSDQSDLNTQLFQSLASALQSMDQGLICSTSCELETRTEAPFTCYYILQPSDNGPMLLRRLAGAEEVLRFPDNQWLDGSVNKKIENSVQACLSKIDLTDYDPLLHERGFHQKLNLLVRESLQFGSILPKQVSASPGLGSTQQPCSEVIGKAESTFDAMVPKLGSSFSEQSSSQQPFSEVIGQAESAIGVMAENKKAQRVDLTAQEDMSIASITEEWEQLIVNEDPKMYSPSCMPKAKLDQSCLTSLQDGNKQLDRETSKILERLEVPRPLKTKVVSPVSTGSCTTNMNVHTKKPLIPFHPTKAAEQVIGSQLMKPNFQRQKRKFK